MIVMPFSYLSQVAAAGPSPILSGLTVYVDAGNTTSYNGSGATWTDLSGNGNNCTLVNSPTFTSGTSGYFSLNGSNQYVRVPVALNTTAHTIQLISMSTPGSKVKRSMWSSDTTSGIGSGTPYRDMVWDTTAISSYAYVTTPNNANIASSYNLNQWYSFALTQASSTQQGYYDLTQTITNRTSMGSTGDNQSVTVGTGYWGYSTMRIAAVLIYNRQLTTAEILQNVNYFDTRY
jgi:hypothetical protein